MFDTVNNFLHADVIKALFIVVVTLGVSFFLGFLFKRLHQKVINTKLFWDDAFFIAIKKPAQMLVWGFGVLSLLDVAENYLPWLDAQWLVLGKKLLLVFLFADFLLRFIRQAEEGLLDPNTKPKGKEEGYDVTTVHAISKLLRAIVLILACLVIMQTLGYSLTGIVAFGGIGGIAVGFAARDLLANFFGAIMLYMDRPFKVGDWIRSPDKNIEGTVEYIGWRLTRIRTFDQRPLYVPNSTFTSISVENPSRMLNRRIKETIGVRYDDATKVKVIVEKVRVYLESNDDIDKRRTTMVNFNEFGSSSLNFFIYCFTKTTVWTEFHKIKEQVLLDIMDIILKEGAEFAFPTQTLHVEPVTVVEQKKAKGS